MLGWRWVQRFRLPLGFRTSMTRRGMGASWGIPGLRFGISPSRRKWVSFGFPGLGLYFFRYLGSPNQFYNRRTNSIISDDGEIIEDSDSNQSSRQGQQNFRYNYRVSANRVSTNAKKTKITKWKNLK